MTTIVNPSSGSSPYITEGTNGIITIRMESTPSGTLYDVVMNDAGAWVSTAVTAGGTFDFIGGTDMQFIGGTYFDFI